MTIRDYYKEQIKRITEGLTSEKLTQEQKTFKGITEDNLILYAELLRDTPEDILKKTYKNLKKSVDNNNNK